MKGTIDQLTKKPFIACVFTILTKPLEDKPATISRKSITVKANASGLAVRGKEDQRLFFGGLNYFSIYTKMLYKK